MAANGPLKRHVVFKFGPEGFVIAELDVSEIPFYFIHALILTFTVARVILVICLSGVVIGSPEVLAGLYSVDLE